MAAIKVRTKIISRGDYYHVHVSYYVGNKRKQTTISTGLRIDGNNKRRAEAFQKKIQAEYENKQTTNSNDMLFADWLIQWLEETQHNIAQSTYVEYKRMIDNRIGPYFREKKLKLCDLKTYHIQEFYTQKLLAGGVKPATIHRYHALIHKALKHAVNMERLNSNPSDTIELPKAEKHTAKFFTEEKLKTLLGNIQGEQIEPVVYLAAWFGLRRGEIIGLRWSSIDLDKKVLTVNGIVSDKSRNGTKTRDLYYEPRAKNDSSIRSFPMPQSSVDYLKKLKADQDYRRKRWQNYNHKWDDFVCVRPNGDLIPLEYVSRTFPKLCEKIGLERLTLHELRHTNISLLVANGENMKTVQEWAGHSTYKQTADTYAHVQAGGKETLAKAIEDILK